MLKTNGPVKNCWSTNNGLPVDKICHLNIDRDCFATLAMTACQTFYE
jgi:hypothetical protein